MKRLAFRVVVGIVATACGGGSATSPTRTFPNMIGGWIGTESVNASALGINISNTCAESWTITSQTRGDFSGTFQTTGGTTVPCSQSGTINGSTTTNGSISDLSFSAQVNPQQGCTLVSRTAYSGVVSSTSLSAQSTERVSCVMAGLSGLVTVDRSYVIALTKR